jgi:hypothetical protein
MLSVRCYPAEKRWKTNVSSAVNWCEMTGLHYCSRSSALSDFEIRGESHWLCLCWDCKLIMSASIMLSVGRVGDKSLPEELTIGRNGGAILVTRYTAATDDRTSAVRSVVLINGLKLSINTGSSCG